MDTDRAAFDSATATGAERIATLLDGEAPPSPLPPPPAAPAVEPGGFSAVAAAPQGTVTEPERPGLLSMIRDRIQAAAPIIAKSLEDANARRAAAAEISPIAVAEYPQRPKWLLWALLGGALALLVVLFKD